MKGGEEGTQSHFNSSVQLGMENVIVLGCFPRNDITFPTVMVA